MRIFPFQVPKAKKTKTNLTVAWRLDTTVAKQTKTNADWLRDRELKILSIHRVLLKAGGAARLQDLLWRADQPIPSHQRIHNWKMRGVIPGLWAGAILWALACKGVNPLDVITDHSPATLAD